LCVLGSIEVFRYVLERFLFGCNLAFGRSNPAVLGDLGGGFRVLESEALTKVETNSACLLLQREGRIPTTAQLMDR